MGQIASVAIRCAGSGEVVVTAHSRGPIDDRDWDANYLAHIRHLKKTCGFEGCANLVFAEGSGPTPKQRAAGSAIFGSDQYRFKVAVITDSLLVRGAVTALRWFNPLIDAFGPSDWAGAFTHARLRSVEPTVVLRALEELQGKIRDVALLNSVVRSLATAKGDSPFASRP